MKYEMKINIGYQKSFQQYCRFLIHSKLEPLSDRHCYRKQLIMYKIVKDQINRLILEM